MRIALFLTVVSAFLFCAVPVAAQPTFERLYGYLDDDRGNSILEASQGGFLVAGTTSDYQNGNRNLYLLRLTGYGETEWSTIYSTPDVWDEEAYVLERADQSFGIMNWCDNDTNYFALHVYEQDGTSRWHHEYGMGDYMRPASMINLPDGGLLACGTIGWYQEKAFLFRTDSEGMKIWSKTYEGSYFEEFDGKCVTLTDDGGYLLAGYMNTEGSIGVYKGLIIRTDSAGNEIWRKYYTNPAQGYGRAFWDVMATSGGQFLVLGSEITAWPEAVYHPFLMCLTEMGNESWTVYYDANLYFSRLSQNANGQYSLAGAREDSAVFVRVDALGTQLHSVTVHSKYEYPYLSYPLAASDGSFLVAGSVGEFGGLGGLDVYVLKANSEGVITGRGEIISGAGFTVHKVPSTNRMIIESREDILAIEVFDLSGRLFDPEWEKSGSKQIILETANLPPGMFLIRCRTLQGVYTDKIFNNQ